MPNHPYRGQLFWHAASARRATAGLALPTRVGRRPGTGRNGPQVHRFRQSRLFCWLLGMVAVALSGTGLAQPVPGDDVPGGFVDIPPMPVAPYPGDSVSTPEVTIIETDTEIITEYRVRGQLYMVQIEPVAGPPYYLIDSNGDGVLDVQQSDPLSTAVQQWRLFSW